jgi:protein-disulfide isomerase
MERARSWVASVTIDLATPVDTDDHLRGARAGRQLVVYGDFECPYTAAAMRDIGRLLEDGPTFGVVYRHFPLRSIHPHAQAAAEAAEAAARQGRFWQMHDLLFRNQRRLEAADLQQYAEEVGLDLGGYESDLAEGAVRPRVARDLKSGFQSGVDGTPSLYIDGHRYQGPRDLASLGRALEPAVAG